jgi:hypothetical protein
MTLWTYKITFGSSTPIAVGLSLGLWKLASFDVRNAAGEMTAFVSSEQEGKLETDEAHSAR